MRGSIPIIRGNTMGIFCQINNQIRRRVYSPVGATPPFRWFCCSRCHRCREVCLPRFNRCPARVTATLQALLPQLRPGQVLCLESTTCPGTTEDLLLPRLQARSFTSGDDFFSFIRRSAKTLEISVSIHIQFLKSSAAGRSPVLRLQGPITGCRRTDAIRELASSC